jgi:hypothetical protein
MTPEEARTYHEQIHAYNEQMQSAYHALFSSPSGKSVLADLISHCHGRKTTFHADARVHAFHEGQRDVLMRIMEFSNLNLEEVYRLRGVRPQTGE